MNSKASSELNPESTEAPSAKPLLMQPEKSSAKQSDSSVTESARPCAKAPLSVNLIVNSNSKIVLSNLDNVFYKIFDEASYNKTSYNEPCDNEVSDKNKSDLNNDSLSNISQNNDTPLSNSKSHSSNSSIKRFFSLIDNCVILDLIEQVQSRKYDARQNLTKITEKLCSDISVDVNVNFLDKNKAFELSITSVTSILSGTRVVKPIQTLSEFKALMHKISGRRVNLCTYSIVCGLNCTSKERTNKELQKESTKEWKIFSKIILKIKRMNEEEIDNLCHSIGEDHMYDSAFLLSPAMEPYICYVSSYDGMTGMPIRKITNILRNVGK